MWCGRWWSQGYQGYRALAHDRRPAFTGRVLQSPFRCMWQTLIDKSLETAYGLNGLQSMLGCIPVESRSFRHSAILYVEFQAVPVMCQIRSAHSPGVEGLRQASRGWRYWGRQKIDRTNIRRRHVYEMRRGRRGKKQRVPPSPALTRASSLLSFPLPNYISGYYLYIIV
jgi:hypothetical protein